MRETETYRDIECERQRETGHLVNVEDVGLGGLALVVRRR